MIRDDVIALIRARLRRDTDPTISTKILTEMKYVQQQIMENGIILPWFLLSEKDNITVTVNERRVVVPPGFLRMEEEESLYITDLLGNRTALDRDDFDALYGKFKEDAGLPTNFAMQGNYFMLFPKPDLAYTLSGRFFLRDTALDTNIENNWLLWASDWMIAETGALIAFNYLDDQVLGSAFRADASVAHARLLDIDEAHRHSNRDYMMGDN